MTNHYAFRYASSYLRIVVLLFIALTATSSAISIERQLGMRLNPDETETEVLKWANGDIQLVGTLYLPAGRGPFPAALMLHGSGSLPRTDRIFREHAERLARAGLAIFVYDKRGVGDSTGDWKQASLVDLADDALGGLNLLRRHPKLLPNRIGFIGISQGPWVGDILISRSETVAFAVWLSGTPVTPAEQGNYVIERALRSKGYDEAAIERAVKLNRQILDVYRTDRGWDEAATAVQSASSEAWFKDSGVGLQPRDSWNWQWYRRFMDYDPVPTLKKLKIPLFAAFGGSDPLIPMDKSLRMLEELKRTGKDVTVVVIPNLGHDLGIRKGPQPELYWTALEKWLRDKRIV
jgi:BAAT / Acyl-CoA thioester hydrolase C terminal./Prolyl oligopeptidase family.